MSDVFHLDLTRAQLGGATLAILPGDPGRVAKIAEHLDDPTPLAAKREYTSYLGTLAGVPIVVCSTGIGGPSTSIAVEELAQLGVRTFLRVGTTGAIQPDIAVADVIVTTGAVRLDGASQHFAPLAYPAVAHHECTNALVDAAVARGHTVHVGITASSDTFYPGQERYDTVSGFVPAHLRGSMAEWQALHVLNYEMESATLLTMCAANGWRAGMVAGVLVNRTTQEMPDEAVHATVESGAVIVVVDAARQLLTV
ncbi:MAG TPA: uridine phosphorylase [Ilumatobacter sp.]|nr:uridine phosphorylase [Ilumatobacter sp.]